MSIIYSFLLHVVAVLLSAFHVAPAETVRVASNHRAVYHRRVVEAAMRAPDTGYWHTSGNQILDEQNRPVRIQGINWYGFETIREVPGGLIQQDYRAILDTIHRNGFNTIRIPLSNQMVESPIVPAAVSFTGDHGPINTDLRGLDSLQILDHIVSYAGRIGLKVILDNHRSEAGDSAEGSGLWYTADYPESSWITDWQRLALRYQGNSTIIGVDLRNEPHNANSGGSCWDCGGARDWHNAAQRAGNAVLRVNPRLLIFVEGTDAYNNDFYWWGGNLEGVKHSPVRLETPNHLVYSAHSYGPNEYRQSWFNTNTTPASLEAVWTRHWAYISKRGIAPVWLGEFGTTNKAEDLSGNAPGSEGQWFQTMIAFLGKNPELNWSSWALNGEDSNGLLDAAYDLTPASPLKMQLLARIESPSLPASAPSQAIAINQAPPVPASSPALNQPAYASAVASSSACHVNYRSVYDTGDSASSLIEIENRTGRPIQGWTLLWLAEGQQIQQARNVRFAQKGNIVMLTGTANNSIIPAGGHLGGIAIQTAGSSNGQPPAKFYLNGALCS